MARIRTLAALAAMSPLLLAACGTESATSTDIETVSITHSQGSTEAPLNPERVAVYDYSLLDTLDALGLSDRVIGLPTASVVPERFEDIAANADNIGSLFEPDIEALIAAEPDVILVGLRSAEAYDDVSKIAPTLDLTFDFDDPVGSNRANVEAIAELFGVEDEAADRLDDIDSLVSDIQGKAAEGGNALIVMTAGGDVSAYGPDSRFGFIHRVLEIPTAAAITQDGRHGEAISFEFIREAQPDHLFVIDRDAAIGEGGAAAATVLDNALVADTPAARNGNIHYLDSTAWYIIGSGLNTLEAMISAIDAAISGGTS
ncbi:ABC transporter substrate-binding protein [Hoyosella rhizosphaerae]|uniref:Iron ABC transporter substrate-binding protein n=1 Tax=Hoyosella rhizosphaerae TaxID=1755582 RepID=A0A916UCZ6_9ACTN|nr:ABC transporter substrate-binding protein [Hoyosella rhizosphaerae]MBN4925819.1 ABC transporter substrate-binding protein [Hoyosella rhizosphaerae]GGC67710.1 iron ABC transporter substrate-binding protein [Hoyosella rhizosphaerae]